MGLCIDLYYLKSLAVRMWVGKEFHSRTPATDNDRSPNCKVVRGISSLLSFAERSNDSAALPEM